MSKATAGEHRWMRKRTLGMTLAAAVLLGVGAHLEGVFADEATSQAQWATSGHADANSEAFTHWNADGNVPVGCAKCHSTPGHLDFLGVDGTQAGVVDNPSPIGTTVECAACHNDATADMNSVVFPSGAKVAGLGVSARCMDCHQGRESGVSVDKAIADANLPSVDTVSSSLKFKNIHYAAAAATLLGGEAKGGYQYAGKSYDVRLAHVDGINRCVDCHQGRASTASVTNAVVGLDPNQVSPTLRFVNVHYFAAGATRYGSQAHGAYEYPGKTYSGLFRHTSRFDTCTECHDAHTGEVSIRNCLACHKGIQRLKTSEEAPRTTMGMGTQRKGLQGRLRPFEGLSWPRSRAMPLRSAVYRSCMTPARARTS